MKKSLLLACAALTIFSCTRDEENEGPELNDLFGEFIIQEAFASSDTVVNFATGGNITFDAKFSKQVDWEIHIVGQTSGAEKIISGKSNSINATNSLWNGTTTNLPMFKAEECAVYLSVPDEGYRSDSTMIGVDSARVVEGFLVADFEGDVNPDWNVFRQNGANMSFNIVQSDSAPQSGGFYDMGGTVDWDFLIGLIDMPASAYGETYFPLSNDPKQVYLNFFLNKPETIDNEIILIRFREDDDGDGVFTAEDYEYSIELRNIPSNWSTNTIRYSDLGVFVNGQPAPAQGNDRKDPDKLLEIGVLFLADPESGYSQTFMDYIIFTEEPLIP